MRSTYPASWHIPTSKTLERYELGKELGLVPPDHSVWSETIETIPLEGIDAPEVRRIFWRVRAAIRNLVEAHYPLDGQGLSAVQLGEPVRLSVVLRSNATDKEKIKITEIVNGEIEVKPGTPLGPTVAHRSSEDIRARLRVPESHILRGYDWNGQPVEYERSGVEAVIDQRQINWYEKGLYPADVAMTQGVRLDYCPPEREEEYLEALSRNGNEHFEWREYDVSQWQALVAGEFALAQFTD